MLFLSVLAFSSAGTKKKKKKKLCKLNSHCRPCILMTVPAIVILYCAITVVFQMLVIFVTSETRLRENKLNTANIFPLYTLLYICFWYKKPSQPTWSSHNYGVDCQSPLSLEGRIYDGHQELYILLTLGSRQVSVVNPMGFLISFHFCALASLKQR